MSYLSTLPDFVGFLNRFSLLPSFPLEERPLALEDMVFLRKCMSKDCFDFVLANFRGLYSSFLSSGSFSKVTKRKSKKKNNYKKRRQSIIKQAKLLRAQDVSVTFKELKKVKESRKTLKVSLKSLSSDDFSKNTITGIVVSEVLISKKLQSADEYSTKMNNRKRHRRQSRYRSIQRFKSGKAHQSLFWKVRSESDLNTLKFPVYPNERSISKLESVFGSDSVVLKAFLLDLEETLKSVNGECKVLTSRGMMELSKGITAVLENWDSDDDFSDSCSYFSDSSG